jgi:hypothetical protein
MKASYRRKHPYVFHEINTSNSNGETMSAPQSWALAASSRSAVTKARNF